MSKKEELEKGTMINPKDFEPSNNPQRYERGHYIVEDAEGELIKSFNSKREALEFIECLDPELRESVRCVWQKPEKKYFMCPCCFEKFPYEEPIHWCSWTNSFDWVKFFMLSGVGLSLIFLVVLIFRIT